MNPLLRGLMSGEVNTNRPLLSYFLVGIVDFVCILLAGERYDRGYIKIGSAWLIAGIVFTLIGWKWPEIKKSITRHKVAAANSSDKLKLVSLRTISTPTNVPNHYRKFVQLECEATAILEKCVGQLLKVDRWSAFRNEWQPTSLDEPIDLLWSNEDVQAINLEPGANRRINLFFLDSDRKLWPRVNQVPLRTILEYSPESVFKFEIRIAANNCPPKYASVKAIIGQEWDSIEVKDITDEQRSIRSQ